MNAPTMRERLELVVGRLSPLHTALTLAIALVLCAAYLALRGSLFFDVDDPNRYLRFGYDLVHHGAYSAARSAPFRFSAMRPPGYPLLVAPLTLLPARLLCVAVLAAHVVLVGASAFLVYRTTRALTDDPRTASLAALLFGSHLELLLASLAPLEHAFFTFLVCAMVDVRFASGARRRPFALGVLGGLAYLTRPTGLLVSAVLLLDVLLERARPLRERLRDLARLAVTLALVVLPWQLAMRAELGTAAIFPATTNGLNLYKGNNADFETYYPYLDVDAADAAIARHVRVALGPRADDEVAVDRYLRRRGLDYVREHPAATLRAIPWKLLYLFSPLPTPIARGTLVGEVSALELRELRWPSTGALVARTVRTIPVLALYAGILMLLRRRSESTQRVISFAYFTASILVLLALAHVATFAETRYRLPFDPLLCVLSAIGFRSCMASGSRGEAGNSVSAM